MMDNNHQQDRQHEDGSNKQQQQYELTLNGVSTRRTEYAPGYRFCPSDEELIMSYLLPEIDDLPLPFDGIPTVDLSKHSPDILKEEYEWNKLFKENELYIFTSRTRKYPKGIRPNHIAGGGYWKPTGPERKITYGGKTIGYKKQLDYYTGNPKKCKRTFWKMHEYRIHQPGPAPNMNANGEIDTKLDRCVLCKIYLNSKKNGNGGAEEASESITNADDNSQIAEETNETCGQNQSNNLVIPGTSSIASAFACSSTYEPSSITQMYGNNTSLTGGEFRHECH